MVDKVGFRFDVGIYFSGGKSCPSPVAARRTCACGSVFAACGWRESVAKHRQAYYLSPKRRLRHKEEPHIRPFGSQCVHPRFRRFGRGGRPYSSGGSCHRQQYGALYGADAAAGALVHRLRGQAGERVPAAGRVPVSQPYSRLQWAVCCLHWRYCGCPSPR